jgi:hypothetical protein
MSRFRKRTANGGIDIPDYEPRDENNCNSYQPLLSTQKISNINLNWKETGKLTTAPSTQFEHLIPNYLILHPTRNYRTGLNSNESNHDTEQDGMHYYFICDAVPGNEGRHEGC